MKLLMLTTVLAFSVFAVPAMAKGGSHAVSGHTTKNGTYVPPHRATNPDSSKTNNWSQKGNVNPYTGKEGTKKD
jgi:hypothetical protein